jgi:hypothetical protein
MLPDRLWRDFAEAVGEKRLRVLVVHLDNTIGADLAA